MSKLQDSALNEYLLQFSEEDHPFELSQKEDRLWELFTALLLMKILLFIKYIKKE